MATFLSRFISIIFLLVCLEVQALVNSAQALWVLFFFIVLGVILFSSAVYYMERLGCPIWSPEEDRDQDEKNSVARYEEECEASNTGYSDSGELYAFPKSSVCDFTNYSTRVKLPGKLPRNEFRQFKTTYT